MKMPLSVVIITFNEEHNIERCLKSVQNVADEIVVVDSFSTDQTAFICKKYNVRLLQREFDGYGNQKQFATKQASFDYILSLDADEVLSKELEKSILEEKRKWLYPSYSFNRRNFYCSKAIRYCGWYPDYQVRLFDRREIHWNDKKVHESIDSANKKAVFHLKGDLLHYTCNSIAEHQVKERKYAKMNSEILIRKGRPISTLTPYIKGFFRFCKTYFLKLGILDGYYGLVISFTLAKSSFHKYEWARKGLRL